MNKIFNKKIGKIFIFLAFLGVGFFSVLYYYKNINKTDIVFASSGDNVFGFAWTSNYGWISFNSTDCDLDCAGPTCTSDGVPAGCPEAGNIYPDYGVRIDQATGDFSGYAWSSNLGWISFEEINAPDYNFNTAPKGNCSSCTSANNCTACLKGSNIYGWAKILSLDDDGWIRLDDDGSGHLGVTLVGNDFMGWGWNNDLNGKGIGWISFNSLSPNSGGGNYKVDTSFIINNPPTVVPGSPFFSDSDLCSGLLVAFLPWTYSDPDGDPQTAYTIQIDNDAGFTSPEINTTFTGNAAQYAFNAGSSYAATYYWRIQVRDSNSAWSVWTNGANIITPNHRYPVVDFEWLPETPSADEAVLFDSIGSDPPPPPTGTVFSSYYDNGNNINDCNNGNCHYLWEITAGNGTILGGDNLSATTMSFSDAGTNVATVRLTITDNDDYSCSKEHPISAKKKLPSWIETK